MRELLPNCSSQATRRYALFTTVQTAWPKFHQLPKKQVCYTKAVIISTLLGVEHQRMFKVIGEERKKNSRNEPREKRRARILDPAISSKLIARGIDSPTGDIGMHERDEGVWGVWFRAAEFTRRPWRSRANCATVFRRRRTHIYIYAGFSFVAARKRCRSRDGEARVRATRETEGSRRLVGTLREWYTRTHSIPVRP